MVDVGDDRHVAEVHVDVLKKRWRALQQMLQCSNLPLATLPLESFGMPANLAPVRGLVMRFCWVFASCLLVSPVAAQEVEQTPDNAQRFLALIGESRDIRLNHSRYGWPNYSAEYKVRFSPAGECSTQVNGTPHAYYNGAWFTSNSSNFAARFAGVIERYKLPSPPLTIAWSKVGSVSIVNGLTADAADYPGQVILIQTTGGSSQFWVADQATAKRVHYAMEFLRVACDRTAETGF